MSDDSPDYATAESLEQPPRPALGTALRNARESLGLTQADVATQLKVAPRKIEAIELEQWDTLPQGPYLRGLVRTYARAVNLDASELLALIDQQIAVKAPSGNFAMPNDLRAPFPQRPLGHSASRAGSRLAAATLICALVAGLIYWSDTDSFRRVEATVMGSIAAGPAAKSAPAGALAARSDDISSAEVAHPVPPVEAASGASPAIGPTATPSAGVSHEDASTSTKLAAPTIAAASQAGGPIKLRFTEDSWVEVRQADGTILLSQLNPAGSEQTVAGTPPLELVIGNAPGVALDYHGTSVELSSHTHDRVARLTLQ